MNEIDKENNIKENEQAENNFEIRISVIENRLNDICNMLSSISLNENNSVEKTWNMLAAILSLQSYYVKSRISPACWKTVDKIVSDNLLNTNS